MKASIAMFAIVLAACGLFGSSKFPSDVLAEYECVQTQVEAGDKNVVNIMAACLIDEEQIVADAISSLLSSKKWIADHPDRLAHAHELLTVARVRIAAKAAAKGDAGAP